MAAAVVTVVLAAAVIALVFMGGLRRGMDHVVEDVGIEGDPTAIAVAISDQVYHLNAGYVAYATVLAKLEEVWSRGVKHPRDEIQFKNNADRDLLNEGLRAAAALGPQAPAFVSDRTLVTLVYEDLGFVDFAKLAFRLFGLQIESLYYTFFLLLALSAAAYLIVFWREPVPNVVLLCTLFAFYIELHTTMFTPDMPTFFGMRHNSTLALVPAWHFAFLVIYRRRASLASVLATLLQLAILLLAIRTRGSATWVVLFVCAVSVVLAWVALRRLPVAERTWRRLLTDALRWPALLLLVGFFGANAYARTTLHPVYFTDDVMPYHGYWHVAYIGLMEAAPELRPDSIYSVLPVGDAAAHAAATQYLHDTHFMPMPKEFPVFVPPGYISPWTGTLKFTLHDEIMRRVVLRIVARHPLSVLKALLFTKPIMIADHVRHVISDRPDGDWLWLILAGGLAASALLLFAGTGQLGPGATLLLAGGALPFAALPNWWAFPGVLTLSDIVLTALIFLQLLVGAAAVVAAGYLSSRLRSRSAALRPA